MMSKIMAYANYEFFIFNFQTKNYGKQHPNWVQELKIENIDEWECLHMAIKC